MIPRSHASWQSQDWQKLLSHAITDPAELLQLLEIDINLAPFALLEKQNFSLRVPRGFIARMEKGNPNDPLLRQVLPIDAELDKTPGYTQDALIEKDVNPVTGLLHKYKNRVLLTITGGCAIHCRYCFRRYFPYEKNNPGSQGWHQAIQYISERPQVNEVILSGGDPLVVPDKYLQNLVQQIAAIPHIDTLRFHTRLPIVLPERINHDLLDWLKACHLQKVIVVHANHPNEIDDQVIESMLRLRSIGATLLNQSVLLKGVNDKASTLVKLSKQLFTAGILPYYLHLLDKVEGTAHFDVPVTTAQELIRLIMQELPGYLVPRLVREQSNMPAKVPVSISF